MTKPADKSVTLDYARNEIRIERDGETIRCGVGSPEGFAAISRAWLRSGWDAKYVYSFTWLGRPVIQLPEDMLRLQEVIFALQPDVVVETGVAHGGSLIFYASVLKVMGRGRVIGVDIEIRPHNRKAIEAHFLSPLISLIEGDATAPATVARVAAQIKAGERVIVLLDSNHTYDHVMAELKAYSPLVPPGSYIVAMDGIMGEVAGAPRTQPDWAWNNPAQAALDFTRDHADFVIEEPKFAFNEGSVEERVSYWPNAFIRRVR